MHNLEKYIINPTNEFHILRHFKYVDSNYKKTLIDQPYWYYDYTQKKFLSSTILQNDIESALKTIGTKFEKNIIDIENPKKLLEIIKEKFKELLLADKIHWTTNARDIIIEFTFEHTTTIGQINLLPIERIPRNDKERIKSVPRSTCVGEDKITVNTISGIDLLSTKTIYVEIKEIKQLPFYIITAFPFCSIPDNLSDEELVFVI